MWNKLRENVTQVCDVFWLLITSVKRQVFFKLSYQNDGSVQEVRIAVWLLSKLLPNHSTLEAFKTMKQIILSSLTMHRTHKHFSSFLKILKYYWNECLHKLFITSSWKQLSSVREASQALCSSNPDRLHQQPITSNYLPLLSDIICRYNGCKLCTKWRR